MQVLRDLPSPAKLNLFLHVVGRRADGYHLLQTAFRFIDLQDTLHLRERADGRVLRGSGPDGVPAEQDLTVRAARLLQEATGCGRGVEIDVEKRIPMGGGLGGGSSDAATVLIALNRLWGTGLDRGALMALALRLGADVPVFVFGRNAFAEGVGEELAPLALPPRWYVVAQPDASVPTAEVFGAPELTRNTPRVKITDFPAGAHGFFGRNDLEAVAFARYPQVGQAHRLMSQALANAGADAPAVRMSGSGACLFVECHSRQQADWAHDRIAAKMRVGPGGLQLKLLRTCAGLEAHPLQDWVAG
ncbi:4-(cytidine 5'-diphospho)-2-C-methyl-D-erythritol kinase [Pigmentiphaga soli]|uniref:4-diphosphocytidyl-2-C-methyl-D-erythritol kinase n=2 Tax=Pigmentiphaga soli TaxID=1007095 RepID=A0ABP8HGY8_9BURK